MYKLVLFFAIVLLCSCNSTSNPKIDSLTTSFPQLAPSIDTFIIDNNQVQILNVNTGAALLLPKNSLVYEDGNTVTEAVTVTFQLFNDKVDMLLSNLTTLSDGDPLVSKGMFKINATVPSGRKMNIQSAWRVEIANGYHSEAKLFEGKIEEDGNINWTNPKEPDNKIIPIPFEILKNYHTGNLEQYVGDFLFIHPDLDIAPYQNTWVASRELWSFDDMRTISIGNFGQTYFLLNHYASYYYYDYEKSYKRDKAIRLVDSIVLASKDYKYNLLHLFTENTNKPLYEMQSIIDAKARQELDQIQEQEYLIDYCCETKYPASSYTYQRIVNNLKTYLSKKDSLYQAEMSDWKKSTVIDDRFLLEVDSAFLRTLRKKYQDSLALREKQYQDSLAIINNQYKKLLKINNSIAAEITTFGWHNVDYFYKITPEKTVEKLLVKTSQPMRQLLIVYKRENMIVPLYNNNNVTFELNNATLPSADVLLLALGWDKKGNIVLGHQELKLEKENNITLSIDKKANVEDIKQILKSIL